MADGKTRVEKQQVRKRGPSIKAWFDLSNGLFLLLLAAIWTVGWASVYAYNMEHNPTEGLRIPGDSEIPQINGKPELVKIAFWQAFTDGLYFSVVTETTVGYGDAAPVGYSKLFACLQVMGGLLIAGLFISKITTIPTGKARILIGRIKGYWLEFSFAEAQSTRKAVTVISFITIRHSRSLLRYDGINYKADGTWRGDFEGTSQPLTTLDGPSPWFDYDNLQSDKGPFTVGKTRLSFEQFANGPRQYLQFTGFADDEGNSCKIPMIGFRIFPRNLFRAWELRQIFRSESEKYGQKRAEIAKAARGNYKAKMEAYITASQKCSEEQTDEQTEHLVKRMSEFIELPLEHSS